RCLIACSSTLALLLQSPSTTPISTLSLHDALPISGPAQSVPGSEATGPASASPAAPGSPVSSVVSGAHASSGIAADSGSVYSSRSEEHPYELQSRENLVCRLLLEKKKKNATVYPLT